MESRVLRRVGMGRRTASVLTLMGMGTLLIMPASSRLQAKRKSPPPPTIRFAVIGDFGSGDENEEQVAELVKQLNPEFIITVGDNNYPDGEAATIDRNVGKWYHGYIFPYYGQYGPGADKNRFFPSLGNHDWHTPGATPYLNYFTLPGNERYYDFTWGPVHLFALSSDTREPDGYTMNSVQGAWLRQRLAASQSPWKFVYFHHPPYSSSRNDGSDRMRWPFRHWGAAAVFSGHDHVYERIMHDGFPYFVNGVGGAEMGGFSQLTDGSIVRYNEQFGAQLVTVSPNHFTAEFFNTNRQLIDSYSHSLPTAPKRLRAKVVARNQIVLTWRDVTSDEDFFEIERGMDRANYRLIASVGADTTEYSDLNLEVGRKYFYRIRSRSVAGHSPYSNVASARLRHKKTRPVLSLAPNADTYVRDGEYAGLNFGQEPFLRGMTSNNPRYTTEVYFKFDLSAVPSFSAARLRIRGRLSEPDTLPVAAFAVPNAQWSETGITWQTRPGLGTLLSGTQMAGVDDAWYELDVTKHLRSELAAGRRVVSLALRHPFPASAASFFYSRETPSGAPELMLVTPPVKPKRR